MSIGLSYESCRLPEKKLFSTDFRSRHCLFIFLIQITDDTFERVNNFNRTLMAKNLNADGRRGHSTLIPVFLLKQKAYPYYNFGKARKAKWGHWTLSLHRQSRGTWVFVIQEKHVQWMVIGVHHIETFWYFWGRVKMSTYGVLTVFPHCAGLLYSPIR